jgi:hypothetical protein
MLPSLLDLSSRDEINVLGRQLRHGFTEERRTAGS